MLINLFGYTNSFFINANKVLSKIIKTVHYIYNITFNINISWLELFKFRRHFTFIECADNVFGSELTHNIPRFDRSATYVW